MVRNMGKQGQMELMSRPKGLLDQDHRAIEHHLEVMAWVLENVNGVGKLQDSQTRALRGALDYFAREASWHTRDEELSLFPRLRAVRDERLHAALSYLDSLEHEHVESLRMHEEIDQLARAGLRAGKFTSKAKKNLLKRLGQLQGIYRHHMEVEDQIVFPRAAAVLGVRQMQQIDREISKRRGGVGDNQAGA